VREREYFLGGRFNWWARIWILSASASGTAEQKRYLKQQTISMLEGQLDPRNFVRIHRSYLVRLDKIARIEPYSTDSRVVVLTDGTQLPVSRAGHARLKKLLGEAG
jgi:two-component system, LytTR family, response regulator